MPPEYRKQIFTLLVQSVWPSVVTNLQTTNHDNQGNVVFGAAVANKPWEWIENLGEPTIPDTKEEERSKEDRDRPYLKHVVKNSSSISLDHFDARLTSEGRKQSMQDDSTGQMEGCQRFFEDGISENIFIRDWRETRWESDPSLETGQSRLQGESSLETVHMSDMAKSQISRASPPLSVASHSSTQGTSSSLRKQHHHSPSSRHSGSTYEVIDVDSLPTTSSSLKGKDSMKRKASGTISDDDEIEIIEGPVIVHSTHVAKKTKAGKAPVPVRGRTRKK